MKKIAYNLASDRRVDTRAFAWRAGVLALSALFLGGLAATNLARQVRMDRSAGGSSLREEGRSERMREASRLLEVEIAAWEKKWSAQLAAANRLIERQRFSFVARLDLLEKVFRPGLSIRRIRMANETIGQVALTVSAQTLRDLFAFYKRLAPYHLAISDEVQAKGEYLVNMSFRIPDETT